MTRSRKLIYFGQEAARPLIKFLNSRAGKYPLGSALNHILWLEMPGGLSEKEHKEHSAQLDQLIEGCAIRPALKFDGRWTVKWQPAYEANPSASEQAKADALIGLAELLLHGLISRVRQCQCCNRYFFAKFDREKFHSKKCQRKNYQSDPKRKKYRREWMAIYRHRLAEREKVRLQKQKGKGRKRT